MLLFPQLLLNIKIYKLFYLLIVMKMTIKIDEELGRKFRAKVVEIKGNKKGALSEAIEEAIKLWLEKHG